MKRGQRLPLVVSLGSSDVLHGELERLELLGAKREGKVLHLANDWAVGEEGMDLWAKQVAAMLQTDPEDKRADWLPAVMMRLFDSVVLHAGDSQIVVPAQHRFRCD